MSAVAIFPKHINPGYFERGLVMQTNASSDCNAAGLEQGTIDFLCLHKHARRFKPKRGTPLLSLPLSDDNSKAAAKQLDYLGVHTSRFTRNAGGPGVGIYSLLCQGAIFAGNAKDIAGAVNPASADDPITLPDSPISSTLDNAIVNVLTVKDESGNVSLTIDALIQYHSLDLHFEYVARDKAQRPRFLKSSYERDEKTGLLILDNNGTLQELLIDSVSTRQSGSIVAESVTPDEEPIIADPRNHWRSEVVYAGTGSRFEQAQAGQFWHVLETTTIKIVQKSDWQPENIEEGA